MLTFLLWVSAILWACFFLQLLFNRMVFGNLLKIKIREPAAWPFISIVVPARDEEEHIRESVTSYCAQEYPSYEVIVVNDRSTDGTPEILDELKKSFAHLKVVQSDDPPAGWLGKLNALETGRLAAKGEWLLFADADALYRPELLKKSVAFVMEQKADMLFLAPRFRTRGVMEAALINNLYFLGVAIYPMALVTRTRWKPFAAGAGVFNLVKREALERCGAFASMKNWVVDDLGLGYKIKGSGGRLAGAFSDDLIQIRIYEGAQAAIRGFTKNTYPLLHTLPWFLPVLFPTGALISLLPYAGFFLGLLRGSFSVAAALALLLMHLTFATLALFFRQPWHIIFTNPLRELGWWWILLRSAYVYKTRGIVWRGRTYK